MIEKIKSIAKSLMRLLPLYRLAENIQQRQISLEGQLVDIYKKLTLQRSEDILQCQAHLEDKLGEIYKKLAQQQAEDIQQRHMYAENQLVDIYKKLAQQQVEDIQHRSTYIESQLIDIVKKLAQQQITFSEFLACFPDVVGDSSNRQQEIEQNIQSLFKNEIEIRYQVMDAVDEYLFPSTMVVRCRVCGHHAPKHTYETVISHCIFGGGRLERFICPVCGGIFGPLKMIRLDEKQLGAEYIQNYKCYSESSETGSLEYSAFLDLNPVKGGTYLNFGAGIKNQTSKKLREEGYIVYDFEPYAFAGSKEYLLQSWTQVEQIKFDGIFSNDLIEHLPDPITSLRQMRSVLKENGRLVHGSGCYEYAFEYTRFHLFFFVGKSLDYIAEQAELNYYLGERSHPSSPFRKCLFTLK